MGRIDNKPRDAGPSGYDSVTRDDRNRPRRDRTQSLAGRNDSNRPRDAGRVSQSLPRLPSEESNQRDEILDSHGSSSRRERVSLSLPPYARPSDGSSQRDENLDSPSSRRRVSLSLPYAKPSDGSSLTTDEILDRLRSRSPNNRSRRFSG